MTSHVLLIEDEPNIAEAIRFILTRDGWRVSTHGGGGDALEAVRAAQPDLLILDEIGVQIGSEHEKLLLFDVLNGRYQQCRPTILISNLSGSDLEAYLGQRVMDRYRECGAVLAFDWNSYRGTR